MKRANFAPEEVNLWRDIFLKFDDDGSGGFDQDEGKKLLQAVGINVNDPRLFAEYKKMFAEVDEDKSGDVDFPEFLLLMRQQRCSSCCSSCSNCSRCSSCRMHRCGLHAVAFPRSCYQ